MSPRWCALFVAFVAASGFAGDRNVHLVAAPPAARCLASAQLIARDTTDGTETRLAVSSPAHTAIVSAKSGHAVTVRAAAEGCWSESAEIADGSDADVVLTLYAEAHMRGALERTRSELPVALEAAAFRSPAPDSHAQSSDVAAQPLDCSYAEAKWDCVVPADLPIDLRLSSHGFAPIYYRNVLARPHRTVDLEPRAMHPGASVSGWIEAPDGKPLAGAQLTLAPAANGDNDNRVKAREVTAHSDARGFFQLTGIAAGEYRLVSTAPRLSPVLLPVVNVRDGESVVWPRAIRHRSFAQLEVRLDPPVDSEGHPWTVALEERIPLAAAAASTILRRPANLDGVWRADTLRADDYRATVQDASGAVLERFDVDLSDSGAHTIPLTVHRIAVRGVLRFGDTPLAAEIRFAHQSGRALSTTTNDLGQFSIPFPTSGKWTPTIYPFGANGPRIRAKAITVPDATSEAAFVEIVLPGGRIRGAVANRSGEHEKAAVHVVREGQLVAQQMTGDDGKFDFIGIDEGEYSVDAEGRGGSARPHATRVESGESVDVQLELQPSRTISAQVLTPDGAPASGAVVRVSTDGEGWTVLFTDVEGRFEYASDADAPLQVIVVTYSYPALIAQLSPRTAAQAPLVLQRTGGKLRLRSRAYVGRAGALAPLNMFFMPTSPLGLYDGAAYLEPGVYSVCAANAFNEQCRQVIVSAMSDQTVDPRESEKAP